MFRRLMLSLGYVPVTEVITARTRELSAIEERNKAIYAYDKLADDARNLYHEYRVLRDGFNAWMLKYNPEAIEREHGALPDNVVRFTRG